MNSLHCYASLIVFYLLSFSRGSGRGSGDYGEDGKQKIIVLNLACRCVNPETSFLLL